MPNRSLLKCQVACALASLAMLATQLSTPLQAATVLDPQNPANFTSDGQQSFVPGSFLRLNDTNLGDYIAFFTNDSDASPGIDVDVFATFQVIQTIPNNADTGVRVVINDGINRSAIAAATFNNAVRGIGLLSSGSPSDPASYPVFVPVDWTAPTSIQLRRFASGDAQIMQVNGVAPSFPAFLPAAMAPPKTRSGATVEFGAASIEAQAVVDFHAFRSQRAVPEPGSLGLLCLGGLALLRRRTRT
jgi:hypothetical protein